MSVAAPEAPSNPDSPPETAGYRSLYIVLLVCGFILRFGFVLWSEIRGLAHRKAQFLTR